MEDCAYAQRLKARARCRAHVIADRPYGEAIKVGVRYAQTPYVATMDADGQHVLEDVWRLWEEQQANGADMVIGRRPWTIRGLRPAMSQVLNLAASIIAGGHIPDMGSGIRIFRRTLIRPLLQALPDGFDFNATLTAAFVAREYDVLWVPVLSRSRIHGKSHVRWQDGILTLRSLCRLPRSPS